MVCSRTSGTLSAQVEVDVLFHDADPMGVTWHGNYFRYLESARAALLGKIGYSYPEMLESGYLWPVVEAQIKYIKSTKFGQRLVVRAELEEYENRLKIAYVITECGSGERVTTASTTQVAVHRERGEMCFASPQVLLDRVRACLAAG